MVRVFLVDDHEVVRRGLIDLLNDDPELEVIGEAGSVAQAMARIPALQPDVAVLDVRLPDGNGIELCRDLLSRLPDLRCLMLTSFTSDEAMLDAILAGASGYVVKDIKGMELAQAVKDVGAGRSLLDNRAAAALMAKLRGAAEKSDPLSGLSEQERVLLDLLGEGLTNKQIAARMFLAEKTVKNYVSRLLAKLGMERRTQAAVFISKLDRPHRADSERWPPPAELSNQENRAIRIPENRMTVGHPERGDLVGVAATHDGQSDRCVRLSGVLAPATSSCGHSLHVDVGIPANPAVGALVNLTHRRSA